MFNNLCDFIKDELKELDHKAANGDLTGQDIKYVDMLTHIKKSLLTVDAMENPEDYGYGDEGYSKPYNMSRGRYSRRGRYGASKGSAMLDELNELMRNAPDERTKHKLGEFIEEMENI